MKHKTTLVFFLSYLDFSHLLPFDTSIPGVHNEKLLQMKSQITEE